MQRLAPARKAGERAVIIACHHPPASVADKHGGSTGLAADIDAASRAAGFCPRRGAEIVVQLHQARCRPTAEYLRALIPEAAIDADS